MCCINCSFELSAHNKHLLRRNRIGYVLHSVDYHMRCVVNISRLWLSRDSEDTARQPMCSLAMSLLCARYASCLAGIASGDWRPSLQDRREVEAVLLKASLLFSLRFSLALVSLFPSSSMLVWLLVSNLWWLILLPIWIYSICPTHQIR